MLQNVSVRFLGELLHETAQIKILVFTKQDEFQVMHRTSVTWLV